MKYEGLRYREDANMETLAAKITVLRGDKVLGTLYPARNFYRTSTQPTTEVDLYHTWRHDLYLILGTFDPSNEAAELKAMFNPLVSFIWWGGWLLVFGTMLMIAPGFLSVAPSKRSKLVACGLLGLFILVLGGSGYAQSEPANAPMGGGGTIRGNMYIEAPAGDELLRSAPFTIEVFHGGDSLVKVNKETSATGEYEIKNIFPGAGLEYVVSTKRDDGIYLTVLRDLAPLLSQATVDLHLRSKTSASVPGQNPAATEDSNQASNMVGASPPLTGLPVRTSVRSGLSREQWLSILLCIVVVVLIFRQSMGARRK